MPSAAGMCHVLVTNDDGPKSPFLQPFIEELSRCTWVQNLTVVVPAEEQSWIGQAVTRFRPLYVTEHRFGSIPGFLVSGTPADCVGIAIEHLSNPPPDLILSGINLGMNAGLPFYLNSGTVGAVRQGVCFGIRGIALSSLIPAPIFTRWREDDLSVCTEYVEDFSRITSHCRPLIDALRDDHLWSGVDLFSINVPWEIGPTTKRVVTPLERLRYQSLYTKLADRKFQHHFNGFDRSNEIRAADLSALQRGDITVAPISYGPSAEELERMERLAGSLGWGYFGEGIQ